MSELDGTCLKTADKRLAVDLLKRCLASGKVVNVEIGHHEGQYSLVVSASKKGVWLGPTPPHVTTPA